MNKYDFDFLKMDEVLYNSLGIVDPTNIVSVKKQIKENLISLQNSLMKKNNGVSDANIRALEKKIDLIDNEDSLDKVLRECVTMKYLTLLSLETKTRQDDSYVVKSQKKSRRNELFAISELLNSVPSLVNFIKSRDVLLKYIDSTNRIINYNVEDIERYSKNGLYPPMKLDIQFNSMPKKFLDEYNSVLEDAGIYTYKFGELIYSILPDEQGVYTQEITRKNFVGVIKKNEFDSLKKYTVLMDDISRKVPVEFYRDIMFSDMLLRNAHNNINYLGAPVAFPDDSYYGYRVEFDDVGVKDLLRAVSLESKNEIVKTQSNVFRVKSVNDAFSLMDEKMEKALKDLFETKENDIAIGDK